MTEKSRDFDIVVVGAGISGLYALHKLRSLRYSVQVFEAGSDVGGTWYWNRYPGARCDVDSIDYSYSFDSELEQEWQWTSRYATQPEILKYLRHVTERFELRPHIKFDTRVVAATYDAATSRWTVGTDQGDEVTAQFCVMASGSLSTAQLPAIPGIENFLGTIYHTGTWPGPVDFSGQRVGVIGTGSSGIQLIPEVAAQADHLYVFQRTANFSIPANDGPLAPEFEAAIKQRYPVMRENARRSLGGVDTKIAERPILDLTEDERTAIMEDAWEKGGWTLQTAFSDIYMDDAANEVLSEFVRGKIRDLVRDPATAEALCPTDHPFGAKRVCKDTAYYQTFNRDNVTLVDLKTEPIEHVSELGIQTTSGYYEIDSLICATGFDALTGTLMRIDIQGRDGVRLADAWAEGPKTYLGLMIAGFPNMFVIAGPGSPSVLSNMVVSIEQHVEWIAACLSDMRADGYTTIEADPEEQTAWVAHVDDVASHTMFMKASSWYLGANIPGKPRVFMPYPAGVGRYREICEEVVAEGYKGFVRSRHGEPQKAALADPLSLTTSRSAS